MVIVYLSMTLIKSNMKMSDEKNNGIPIFKMPNSALFSVQEKDIFKERVERVTCVKVRFKFL